MGGAASNCSCQAESRTQDLGGSSTMYPKTSMQQVYEEHPIQQKEEKPTKSEPIVAKKPTDPKVYDFINNITTRKLQQTISDLKDNKVFLDTEYPPTLDSLTKNSNKFHEAKDLKWRRLGSISGNDKMVLIDSSSQSKVSSTSSLLGQNNSLSFAISVIGSRPQLVKQLFEIEEYNEQGVYSVWLNFNGEWKEVIVDDQIPCFTQGAPAFIKPQQLISSQGVKSLSSSSTQFEFWSLLLEKACAKLYQSYDKLDIGQPEQIITDFTGAPYQSAQTIDSSTTWKFITSSLEKKFIVTAAPKLSVSSALANPVKTSQVNKSPLKESITETPKQSAKYLEIIDSKEVEVNSLIREKLIKVRNPLGPAEWKGDWSGSSQKWTPELRELVERNKEESHFINLSEQGISWMPLESFCQSYQYIYSNCIHPNYYFYSRNITTTPSSQTTSNLTTQTPPPAADAKPVDVINTKNSDVINTKNSDVINTKNSDVIKNKGLFIVPFEVEEDNTDMYLQYHLVDKRSSYKQRGNCEDNPSQAGLNSYSPVNFFLFKGNEKKITEYIREEYGYSRNGCIESVVNKGSYVAVLNVKWSEQDKSSNNNGLVLSSYSNKRIDIQEAVSEESGIDGALDQCLMNIPPLMTKDIFKYAEDQDHIERYHNVSLNYSYYVYKNTSQTTTLKETAVMTDRKYLTICPPYMNSDRFTIEVQPLQKKIVKYAISSDAYGLQQGNLKHYSIFSYSNEDLFPKIKADIANRTFQVVDGQPTQVEFYQHLFNGGLALFFLNNSTQIYCEQIKVELNNLASSSEGYSSQENISIEVASKRTKLIIFPQIDPTVTPTFKVTSTYKHFK